jgi:hypothetical protein
VDVDIDLGGEPIRRARVVDLPFEEGDINA